MPPWCVSERTALSACGDSASLDMAQGRSTGSGFSRDGLLKHGTGPSTYQTLLLVLRASTGIRTHSVSLHTACLKHPCNKRMG
jgi:hypothetical protein